VNLNNSEAEAQQLARLYPFGNQATPGGDFRHYRWGEFLKVRRKWRHAKTFPHRESTTYTRRIFCHREMDKVEQRWWSFLFWFYSDPTK
jgi:hypothetical protein